MRLLTVNAGSSSLKLVLLDGEQVVARWDELPERLPPLDAVAHRIVHGGTRYVRPTLIDDHVEQDLRELTGLAPLHQPKSLRALDIVRTQVPDVPHVACFDTAFHATIPPAAATYAVPAELTERYALRRYGFHGLAHAWVASRVRELAPAARRIVTCHLGAGASLCAVLDGRSVDTTMGFTPLEGLVMATRSGSLDPGLVLWLAERVPDLGEQLEHGSGLRGLAGTGDMRALLERTDPPARLALAVYEHRLVTSIAAMAGALGGIDALAFSGGVGEHAAPVRADTGAALRFLGVQLDGERNAAAHDDAEISAAGAGVRSFVVSAREELEMAREVAASGVLRRGARAVRR